MRRSAVWLAAGFALLTAPGLSQEPSRGPDGSTHTRVSGVEVLAIPDEPFSAKDTIDWTRTQADGTNVTMHLDAFLARDSRGRIYRERHRFVPAGTKDSSPLYEIHMMDPVTRTQLHCNGRTFQCILSDYTPQTSFLETPEGDYDQGNKTLRRESLGADSIEGIPVVGTRESMSTRAGAAGNDREMVTTREIWYSEELKTNLAVTRDLPLEGKQVIRLSHISRTEPDGHLWDVPIGFSVKDMRRPVRRARQP